MKNRIRIQIIVSIWCMAICLALVSCDDWTEPETLPVENPDMEKQNPELYAKYLESLRTYKSAHHKVVYAWFDNREKVPFNRAQHISNLPDSVDYAVLMYPDELVERELKEMDNIRIKKAMKVLFSVSYDALKLTYDEKVKAHQEAEDKTTDPGSFLDYLMPILQKNIQLIDKYGYDGMVMSFNGKSTLHMGKEEKNQYLSDTNAFIGIIQAWSERITDKWLVFEGKPQNLLDKTILNACKHIILFGTIDATNSGKLDYEILSALTNGVPIDRFIVGAKTHSLDQADVKTGYWADGSRAVVSSALWAAATYSGYTVAGLAVYDISNDYYNTKQVYQYTRQAINIMNPSLK